MTNDFLKKSKIKGTSRRRNNADDANEDDEGTKMMQHGNRLQCAL